MRKTVIATALLLCGLLPAGAGASTLTFDLPADARFPTYTEQGYQFTNNGSNPPIALGTWGPFSPSNSYTADKSGTSATLFQNYGGTTTTFSAVGGGAFDLTSIDFADVLDTGDSYSFNMQFNFVGGGSTTGLYTLDNSIGLQTITFNLKNLLSVTWKPGPTKWLQWDNVNVAASAVAPTPIPASLPLLVSALGGLGLLGWKRRKSAGA